MPAVFHAGAMRVANNLRPKRRSKKGAISTPHPEKSTAFDTVISDTFEKVEVPQEEAPTKSRKTFLEGSKEGWPRRLVQYAGFVVAVNLAIMASAVQMGIQAELGEAADDIVVLKVLENIFTALFLVEMLLKLYVQGCMYFMDLWNVLDFAVAWVSIIYAWIIPFFDISSTSNLSVIKAFRLLRLLRLIKLTNSIPTLRMVVEGLIGSMRALFWVVLLLMLIVYLFAIICVEVIGSSPLGTYPGYSSDPENITSSLSFASFNNFEYFGTVSRAMATLFSMSILAEWDSFRPVWEFQPWCTPIIAVLIFCTTFGVVNVIIGVIVEHTTNSMNEIEAQEEEKQKHLQMEHISTVASDLWTSDNDGDGDISRDEMRNAGGNQQFVKHFREMDLPKGFTFDDLYDMCNLHGKDGLTQYDFTSGMQRMIFSSEFQKTCLVMLGMGQIKQLHRQMVKEQTGYLDAQFGSLREDIHAITAEVRRVSSRVSGGSAAYPAPPPPWPDKPATPKVDKSSVEELIPSQMSADLVFDPSTSAYGALQEARRLTVDSDEVMLMPVAEPAVASSGVPMTAQSIKPPLPTTLPTAEEIVTETDSAGVVMQPGADAASGSAREPGCSQRRSRDGAARDTGPSQSMSSDGEPGALAPSQGAAFSTHALALPVASEVPNATERNACWWVFKSFG